MGLRLRPAKLADVAALAKLERACFPPGTGWGKRGFTEYLTKKWARLLVLLDGDELVASPCSRPRSCW
jgi:hypothetical protein